MPFTHDATLIFDAEPQWGYAREPVLRRMPDGSLFCLHYSGGPREPNDRNLVLATRSQDGGATWSEAEVLFRHSTRGVWATELFVEGGRPRVFVHTLEAGSHYLDLRAHQSFSDDSGRTWTEPVSVPGGVNGGTLRQGIVLADGAWLFPFYWQEALGDWDWQRQDGAYTGHRPAWRFCSGVLRSTDEGAGYTLHGNLRSECDLWEPNAVEVAPNRIVMLMRASGAGVLHRADSEDGGLTWSAPRPTDIPNPGTKFTLLSVDDTVLLINNADARQRVALSVWASRDGCETWRRTVDVCTPETSMFYPHGFADPAANRLVIACEDGKRHYLTQIPLDKAMG